MNEPSEAPSTEGVHRVAAVGKWRTGGELPVCLAKPPLPGDEEELGRVAKGDLTRPFALALAEQLLGKDGKLQQWLQQPAKPRLLIFPELAFGSCDFAALDDLVRRHEAPLLMLAGFGFCSGANLRLLLSREGVSAAWPGGGVNVEGSYNGGWCWVHRPGKATECHVFLKNFRDPNVERSLVPNPVDGDHILRLDLDDLVLFPLICADLLCDVEGSPHARLVASLKDQSPPASSRVLTAGLLLTPKPFHHAWRSTIDRFVEPHDPPSLLVLANHEDPLPVPAEDNDKWRCLTGVFVRREVVPKAPDRALHHLRFVRTGNEKASGLVVRCTGPGAALGHVRWEVGLGKQTQAWTMNGRFEWTPAGLVLLEGEAAAHELRRYVRRRERLIVDRFSAPARRHVVSRLARLREAREDAMLCPRLLPRLLDGPEKGSRDPDGLHQWADGLDIALGVLAAIEWELGENLNPAGSVNGQLRLRQPEIEVLVWVAPGLSSRDQYGQLQQLALQGGGSPPLLVVGGGRRWGAPQPSGRVEPGRSTAITRTADAADRRTLTSGRTFTQPRVRLIYWRPVEPFGDALAVAETESELRSQLEAALELSHLKG